MPDTVRMNTQNPYSPKSDWEVALEGKDLSRAAPYSMYDVFAPEEVISHEAFGHGVVVSLQPDNKIEVLFNSGYKILPHDQII